MIPLLGVLLGSFGFFGGFFLGSLGSSLGDPFWVLWGGPSWILDVYFFGWGAS